ncbi:MULTISPECIES: hypothetical protein [unclassified Pseudomonas]|uniref:hypothetical protein n=1 Tax=unclassified Pseudomonas TaxID=196821 RepID=UPI000A201311|nr:MULTISPECIES: hypothetical protein [unclassified Pseudomonas]
MRYALALLFGLLPLLANALETGERLLSRRELSSQAVRIPCGSGFSREESNAVHGTGCAGVRG